jgi:hypothetical protein
MKWSTRRRIDSIKRSAKPFCQGEAGAVSLSRMLMARNRRVGVIPYAELTPDGEGMIILGQMIVFPWAEVDMDELRQIFGGPSQLKSGGITGAGGAPKMRRLINAGGPPPP